MRISISRISPGAPYYRFVHILDYVFVSIVQSFIVIR